MMSGFFISNLLAILFFRGNALSLPCFLGGGSPSLLTDCTRITGSILIMQISHYYRFCGLASRKPKSDSSGDLRRVDRSSTERSTKGRYNALPRNSFSPSFFHHSQFLLKPFLSSKNLCTSARLSLNEFLMEVNFGR